MQKLEELRKKVNAIDDAIIKKLAQRQKLVLQIGKFKAINNLPIRDLRQEEKLFKNYEVLCEKYGLSAIFIKRLFNIIFAHSRKLQRS
jgi:chorismate mutase / prephenate dehydratase